MQNKGIVRRVDDLGRIVIPMELRRSLGIKVKDPLEITAEGDRVILSRPQDACAICGATDGAMAVVRDRQVCAVCIDAIKKS